MSDRLMSDSHELPDFEDTPVVRHPEWIHAVDNKILDLADLGEGWDGEFAYQIMSEAVLNSRKLADQIGRSHPDLPPPTVTPTIDGKVVLEWYTKTHSIDFTIGHTIDVFYRDKAASIEWEGPLDSSPINPIVFLIDHHW